MTKKKTSRDTYNEWVNKFPNGTIISITMSDEVFVAVGPTINFAFEEKRPKKTKKHDDR